jgi:hypothetical protein
MTRVLSHAGRRLGAGLLALTCAAGIALWLAFDDGDRQTTSSGPAVVGHTAGDRPLPGSGVPVALRADRLQAGSFSLLRTPPEGLPAGVTEVLRSPAYGLNWRLAQRMPSAEGISFWIVPGNDVLCIVSQEERQSVSTTCARTRDAIAQGLAAVLLRERSGSQPQPDHRLIVGIAPDGARRIRVSTRGEAATVPVIDGAFTLRDRVMDPPDRMTFL